MREKAFRFDLDQLGIESRERNAIELVELRARVADLELQIATMKGLLKNAMHTARGNIETDWWSVAMIEYKRRRAAEKDLAVLRRAVNGLTKKVPSSA